MYALPVTADAVPSRQERDGECAEAVPQTTDQDLEPGPHALLCEQMMLRSALREI